LGLELWMDALKSYVEELKGYDSIYPHSPTVGANIFHWYDLFQSTTQDDGERKQYVAQALAWAEKCVERSPRQSWFREWYGKALWLRANAENSDMSGELLAKGLEQYRIATTLYPISPSVWSNYGRALKSYGQYLSSGSRAAEGAAKIEEGEAALEEAKRLASYSR